MSRILVTGASGFIGGALTDHLLAKGHRVAGSYNKRKPEPRQGAVFERVRGLHSFSDWRPLLEGADMVVHCAARVHRNDKNRLGMNKQRAANRDATLSLAEQAQAAGVRRFVFLSTVGAKIAKRPYQIAKLEAEEMLRSLYEEKEMEIVILRAPLVVGPGGPGNLPRLARWIAKGRSLPLASIKNQRSLVTLESLLAAIELCLTHPDAPGGRFEVTDEPPLSTPEVARTLAEGMGQEARLSAFPPLLLNILLWAVGREIMAEGLLTDMLAEDGELREKLGWQPPGDLRAALNEVGAAALKQLKR